MTLDWEMGLGRVRACIPGTEVLAVHITRQNFSEQRVLVNFDPHPKGWLCAYRTDQTVEEIMADYDKMWEEILDGETAV
jgi:hypothetical protein